MLFNSLEYALFLGAIVGGYRYLSFRKQNILLLIASYAFYAAWDWRFLSLIWISTIVDFTAGRRIAHHHQQGSQPTARRWMLLSIATNLGLLGIFKYFGFFVDSAVTALGAIGITTSATATLGIVLPVGISFYTFQTMSYTLDIWRQKLEPTRNLGDFALFVAFFPQLVAGPIERAANLLPQIQRPRQVDADAIREGLGLILIGLLRKVLIADTAGAIADTYFASPTSYGSIEMLAGLLLYALQIYGDFAGYSNIARGSARLLGFTLMRNFRHPYFASNASDFWRRWHISLSTWLRDYLYIPLGGNRLGTSRTYLNLMATMLLGGLWHGASWNFVLWGALHGSYLALHRLFSESGRTMPGVSGAILTVGLATLTWLPFRLTNLQSMGDYIGRMVALVPLGEPSALVPVIVLLAITLAIDIPQHRSNDELPWLRWAPIPQGAFAGAVAVALILGGGGLSEPFIYFQF